jgi:hypothetical protein
MSTVGPPNKNPCISTSKNKDINNKSKQNYCISKLSNANYVLKPVLCFIQQQEVVESQQIQPTGEQLSIVIGDECVGPAWWNMYVNIVPLIYLLDSSIISELFPLEMFGRR